jgi:y4mF family transcriptional regulator
MRIIFPYGNKDLPIRYTTKDIGEIVRQTRKSLRVTQKSLALTSGTGLRFIIDLEHGKPTCELQKTLTVLQTLGIKLELHAPSNKGMN